MPYNGSGGFTLSSAAFTPGTVIASAAMNADLSDIATGGLSNVVTKDGQQTITGQIKFQSGSASAPSVTFGTDSTTGIYYNGTNQISIALGGTQGVTFNYNNIGSSQSGNVIGVNTPTGIVAPGIVGAMADFAGSTAPLGWLFCFGQILNISSYPELFANISNAFGGNGTTTFGIPDCRGRTTYGKDNMGGSAANRITAAGGNYDGTGMGNSGGFQSHILTTTEMPVHSHANFLTDPGHNHTMNNNTGIVNGNAGGNLLFNVNGSSVNVTVVSATTGLVITNANAGSGNAFTTLGPSIILNKIIFAGRQ